MFWRTAALGVAFGLSGCSVFHDTNAPTAAPGEAMAVAEGPPMVDGVYTFSGCEGEGACSNRNWRTVTSSPLLAGPLPTARVIGTLAPGEWVHVEETVTRLIPRRGVAREDTADLRTGEVIYVLQDMGEGLVVIWRRGEYTERSYEDVLPHIDLDDVMTTHPLQASLGTWARVRRENGQIGWVAHQGQFECTASIVADLDCRD